MLKNQQLKRKQMQVAMDGFGRSERISQEKSGCKMQGQEEYRAVSLFSGCGGMDVGFEREGIKIIHAIDSDSDACETYRRNFKAKVVNGDVTEMDFDTLPNCDVIIGGFPCQDFSIIWKRQGLNTDRGNLYKQFVNAILAKTPKVFVAENVRGLLSVDGGRAFEQIKIDFAEAGYTLYPHVYNFADYGVPQNRHRLIIVGIRNDLDLKFEIPKPTHGEKKAYVTTGQALQGVEKIEANSERMNIADRTRKMLEMIPPGGNFNSVPKSSPYRIKGLISHVYRRAEKDKPSYTIIASGGGGTWGYHYEEPRPFTNRERARIQTFPDDFVFYGRMASVRRQIGNAVPPKGIQPVARMVARLLDSSSIRQTNRVPS